MSSTEQLFDQYVEAFRSGDKDPRPFLRAAPEAEREELSRLIELFLMRTDPQEWDGDAFAGSDAERLTERILPVVMPGILTQKPGWGEMLPALRMKQKWTRLQVSLELAKSLKATREPQIEKVGDYYHDMEHGNLRPQGVSAQVLDSLAEIYGTTVEALRRAGDRTVPSGGADAQVFARMVSSADHDFGQDSPGDSGFSRISGKPDWIDRLFIDADYNDPDR